MTVRHVYVDHDLYDAPDAIEVLEAYAGRVSEAGGPERELRDVPPGATGHVIREVSR